MLLHLLVFHFIAMRGLITVFNFKLFLKLFDFFLKGGDVFLQHTDGRLARNGSHEVRRGGRGGGVGA